MISVLSFGCAHWSIQISNKIWWSNVLGARWPMPCARWQVSGAMCHVSGAMCQVPCARYQVQWQYLFLLVWLHAGVAIYTSNFNRWIKPGINRFTSDNFNQGSFGSHLVFFTIFNKKCGKKSSYLRKVYHKTIHLSPGGKRLVWA